MKPSRMIWCVLALVLAFAGEAAAQIARVSGEVRDLEGKPFADVAIVIKNKGTGQTFQLKTDKNGRFAQILLTGGTFDIDFKVKEQVVHHVTMALPSGSDETLNVNFKELAGKQSTSAAALAAQKKQEEELKHFDALKGHFDVGRTALDQANLIHDQIKSAPADQRAALQQKSAELYQTAINEFQEAQKMAAPNEPGLHLIWANMGLAADSAGRYEEAVAAYQKAIELKPRQTSYYTNLGNALARLGKIDEARTLYEKAATLDPANAAMNWRNLGIVLSNANKMKEALEPLRKAAELDPKSAQTWYLLGAALVNAMEYKTEGDKLVPILQPGTIEAYQKCIELDPKGAYGTQAKQGLEALEAMGLGIQTKVKATKKK